MTTKDKVLQESINILISQGRPHAIDIEVFNYYYRKFGSAQGSIFNMSVEASEIMSRAYANRVEEYEKQQYLQITETFKP